MLVHEMFEAQVQRTPHNLAVTYKEQSLTYREVNARANQLARYLKNCGVGPETIVAVCLDHCPDLVVAMFAVLKAGGASLLLNPEYPQERLSYMLTDTKAGIVLTHSGFISRIQDAAASPVRIVCLDDSSSQFNNEATENLKCETAVGDLAFVFYTSGSTGTPKAVMWLTYDRRAYTDWEAHTFQLREGDRHLLRAPIGFTLLLAEVLMPLLTGGHLIIVPSEEGQDAGYLVKLITEHDVVIITVVPTLLQALIEQPGFAKCGSLREVSTIGEPLTERLKRDFFFCSQARLSVMYGATEVGKATFLRCERTFSDEGVRIGAALPQRSIHLLNDRFERVGTGESGEICVGGGLTRGYFNRPDLTAEKFIPDPFSTQPGARLYRTGDLGRYLPDRTIEFIGRVDDQIKVHGFRIEPAEIEKAICEHPAVSQAAVLVTEGVASDAKLIVYLTARGPIAPSTAILRRYLKDKLPAHMIPVRFVTLAVMPLMPNGKLDRRALPEPEKTRPEIDTSYVPPSSPVERTLANIWGEVMDIERVGLHDNFFDLGGHSLLAVQLISRIEKRFEKSVPVAVLFQSPTIEQLAKVLDTEKWPQSWPPIVSLQGQGSRPPFFWFHAESSTVVLLDYLGSDQPLYGFEHQGHDGTPALHREVDAMAKHYLNELRRVVPNGPYLLGGFSFGAVIAFEMASQLKREGQDVPLLFMLDPFGKASDMKLLQKQARPLRARFVRNLRRLRWTSYLAAGRLLPPSLRSPYILDIYMKALQSYVPQPYTGSVVIFKTPGSYQAPFDWVHLISGDFEVYEMFGNHMDLRREPQIAQWAKHLKGLLDRVTESTVDQA